MNFSDAIRSGISNYANFSGRASRSEYWFFQLFFLLCMIGFMIFTSVISASNFTAGILGFVAIIGYVGFVIPLVSVGVRRLHDRNMAGWWYLIVIAPMGQFILLIIFVLKGNEGPNDYGPDPLNGPDFEPFETGTPATEKAAYSRSSVPPVIRK